MPEKDERLAHELKEKPLYDGLYTKDKSAFGGATGRPEQFVEYLAEYLKEGVVFEIGAGQGRNALWLARQGFQVEATDISEVGVAQMRDAAAAASLPVIASIADARDPLAKEYDAIVGTYVFHHLPKADAVRVLEDFKKHTKPGGYQVIAVFTTEGDFYRKNPDTPYWYAAPGELQALYAGWNVLRYDESVKKALATDVDGGALFNTVARILVQKK